jgi:hypothetical protein
VGHDEFGDATRPEGYARWDQVPQATRIRRAKDRVRLQNGGGLIDQERLRVFEELVRICDQRNIKIITVRHPITPEYRSALADLESDSALPTSNRPVPSLI